MERRLILLLNRRIVNALIVASSGRAGLRGELRGGDGEHAAFSRRTRRRPRRRRDPCPTRGARREHSGKPIFLAGAGRRRSFGRQIVTSAVSEKPREAGHRRLSSEQPPADQRASLDDVLPYDFKTGKIVWEREAHRGPPRSNVIPRIRTRTARRSATAAASTPTSRTSASSATTSTATSTGSNAGEAIRCATAGGRARLPPCCTAT